MIIMFVRSQENNNKSEFHNCISPERHQDITKKADHITIVTIKFEKNAYDRYFCCRVVLAPSADNIRLLLNKKKFYVKPILSFLAKFTCLRISKGFEGSLQFSLQPMETERGLI